MKNEFVLAFNEVLEEKQLPKEVILTALESAMVSAYRRAVNASTAQKVDAKVDPETGKVAIFAEKEVVESVQDSRTEVTLAEAHRYAPDAEIGSMVTVESTPRDFGRVAAQTARQVIQQRIRDAERQAQLAYYEKQLGEIVSSVVQAVNAQGLTVGMEMRAEGVMSRKDMIPGERFRIHDRVRALVAEVKDSPRGPQIILSRTHRDFLRRLLENEVPEIYHGVVEIRSIAREPGERAKVAVSATQAGIDPVGACVGIRGVRIQAIVRELHDEKIDVIEWNPDPAAFIAKAISPARVVGVYLIEKAAASKTATVVVPEDQLSLAIGRDGQNARLAAKLTSWRIDIKSLSEAASDAMLKLKQDPTLAAAVHAEVDMDQIDSILVKKADGRPLTPEEYDVLTKFVDRIEKRTSTRRQTEKKTSEATLEEKLREKIPAELFEKNILDSGLPEHVAYILQEASFATVGDLAVQMQTHPDDVFRLQGIGPKAMAEINALMEPILAAKPAQEAPAMPAAPAEAAAPAETAKSEIAAPSEEIAAPEKSNIETVIGEAAELPASAEGVGPVVETGVTQAASPEEEEEASFDKLFTLKPGVVEPVETEEEEEEEGDKKGKKGKKKKRKSVEVEYDPDRDLMLIKKKHKRGDGDWDWEP
ncbi:MAG: transcription termination factor NusA [Anaerolineaceae bacterium]|nr:transcription termination factor NusA [Anaerolineaceae bacterium]